MYGPPLGVKQKLEIVGGGLVPRRCARRFFILWRRPWASLFTDLADRFRRRRQKKKPQVSRARYWWIWMLPPIKVLGPFE
jgi:hypothetical protein